MSAIEIGALWLLIGFFVNYKWGYLPFLPSGSGKAAESQNVFAVFIFIIAPLALAISLFIVVFIREWKDKKI